MRRVLVFWAFFGLICAPIRPQDAAWVLEQAPTASGLLLKVLEKAPAFSGRLEVTVTQPGAQSPTSATGSVEYQNGNIRWDVKLGDIASSELSSSARALARQINGERLILLAEARTMTNTLVLPGVSACLEQPCERVNVRSKKVQPVKEKVDGRLCIRERWLTVSEYGGTNDVILWRVKELKDLPVQAEFSNPAAIVRIHFKDVRLGGSDLGRFNLNPALARYETLEDLVQSVLVDRVRKRIGLE